MISGETEVNEFAWICLIPKEKIEVNPLLIVVSYGGNFFVVVTFDHTATKVSKIW